MTGEASWLDSMPEIYDRCLGPALFAPYAQHLAGIAVAHDPQSALELAAGTGIVTAELVRMLPTTHITATDLNSAMVSWAANRVTGPTWLPADALHLDFRDATFDLIVCQFGVMFFPDKTRAFAEAARVLRPGGALLFAVWDAVETSRFASALVTGLAELLPDDSPDFVVRIPHGYHDPEQIRLDVASGGLVVESIEHVVLRGTAPSAGVIAEGFCQGTPLRFALEQRGDLEQLTEAVAERMTVVLGAGPIESDLAAYIVTARRR